MGIYKMCRTFRALPYEGGVLNQPKHAVNRLLAIMAADDRINEEESKKAEREKKPK